MASALTRLEQLQKAHTYLSGANKLVKASKKMLSGVKSSPQNISGVEKALGLSKNKYVPLSVKLISIREDVKSVTKQKFPAIKDHSPDAKAEMAKLAKAGKADSPAFEKALDAYIYHLEHYETRLADRANYMRFIGEKCDLNIKDHKIIKKIIVDTDSSLHAIIKAVPDAGAGPATEVINMMKVGLVNIPDTVINAYKKLKSKSAAHGKEMEARLKTVRKALKDANSKKAKFLLEDAADFVKSLF